MSSETSVKKRMAHTNRGADIPMDKLDVAFQPHRNHSSHEENEEEELNRNDLPKKITGKVAGMLDANAYATKKTIAQGMLDVALLTANASQLKYLLQVGTQHEFYHLMLSLISISIILQVSIGALILIKSRYSINIEAHHRLAEGLNNLVVWLVFAVTLMNVFVSALGLEPPIATRARLRGNQSSNAKP